MMTFDQLIAPMTVGEFLRDVHGRTHKLLRGAAGRFAGLLTWRDLNRILAEHRLDHPRLRLCGAGGADHDGFVHHSLRRGVLRVPRLDAAALQQRLRDGATLILNDVDELHTPIGRLALALERLPEAHLVDRKAALCRDIPNQIEHRVIRQRLTQGSGKLLRADTPRPGDIVDHVAALGDHTV